MPQGHQTVKTIEKEAARAALRQIVLEHMQDLVGAQLANAKGISHFFLRDKAGQFVKIEDPKLIAQALNSGSEGSYYYIFTKDPSIQAFTDLMNRAIDKPAEQEQQHAVSGTLVVKWDGE